MTRRPKHDQFEDYVADKINGTDFVWPGHVHISGDIKQKGTLVVGGTLTVDGDLEASDVYCLGSMIVKGCVNTGNCHVGQSIEVGGDLRAMQIDNGYSIEDFADLLRFESVAPEIGLDDGEIISAEALELWLQPDVLDELEQLDLYDQAFEINVGGSLICYGLDLKAVGVTIGKRLDVDAGEINCSLTVDELVLEDDLSVYGHLICNTLSVGGNLMASKLTCHGDAVVGGMLETHDDLSVQGTLEGGIITCGRNIQVGRWLTATKISAREYLKVGESVVCEETIQTGKDYGILAGLCVARNKWTTQGFVSAAKRPRNILSGAYVPGKFVDVFNLSDDTTAGQKA